MKRQLALVVIILCLLPARRSASKVDPLQIITDQVVRPDIVIVLDNSSSMSMRAKDGLVTGTDCSGPVQPNVDLANDGMCSGAEVAMKDDIGGNSCTSATTCNNYYQDCNLYQYSNLLRTFSSSVWPPFSNGGSSNTNRAGSAIACVYDACAVTNTWTAPVNADTCCSGTRNAATSRCTGPDNRGCILTGQLYCSANSECCSNSCNTATHRCAGTDPGTKPATGARNVLPSRMYMVKHVLRRIVPELSATANFSLVTFRQNKSSPAAATYPYRYYQYKTGVTDPANSSATPPDKPVTFYLTKAEMKMVGAWDTANNAPLTHFKWKASDGVVYDNGDITSDPTNQNKYHLLSAFNSVTVGGAAYPAVASKLDSLYADTNSSAEARFNFVDYGLAHDNLVYQGSYYTYLQKPAIIHSVGGAQSACRHGTLPTNTDFGQTACDAHPAGWDTVGNPANCCAVGFTTCGYCTVDGAVTNRPQAQCGSCTDPLGNPVPTATTQSQCGICSNTAYTTQTSCVAACSCAAGASWENPLGCTAGEPGCNCRLCDSQYRLTVGTTKYCMRCGTVGTDYFAYYPDNNDTPNDSTSATYVATNACKKCYKDFYSDPVPPSTTPICWSTDTGSMWVNRSYYSTNKWGAAQWSGCATWTPYTWSPGTWTGCTRVYDGTITATARDETVFKGPQFVSGTTTYVSYAFNPRNEAQGNVDYPRPLRSAPYNTYDAALLTSLAPSPVAAADTLDCSTMADGTNCSVSGQPGVVCQSKVCVTTDNDYLIGPIMAKLNDSRTGGLRAWEDTPTGTTILAAHQHLIHKAEGTCDYTGLISTLSEASYPAVTYPLRTAGDCPFKHPTTHNAIPDDALACRKRFVLVLTDGDYDDPDHDPVQAAADLFNDTNNKLRGPDVPASPAPPPNPVKTLVVGLPGLPLTKTAGQDLSPRQKLAEIADAGADGVVGNNPSCCCVGEPCTNTCTPGSDEAKACRLAYFADDEAGLQDNIIMAIYEGMTGDYATAQASVATSSDAVVSSNIALVASTSFPNWRGHLRAWDVGAVGGLIGAWSGTGAPPTGGAGAKGEDAGKMLADALAVANAYKSRPIYTGYAASGGGSANPIPLYDSGSVNPALSTVWSTAGGGSLPSDFSDFIAWLAGNPASNPWPLGPLFRMTPAVVGPPPSYEVGNHGAAYESVAPYKDRPTLAYVPTNNGVLHAFRLEDPGTETGHIKGVNGQDAGKELFAYVPPNLLPKLYKLYTRKGHVQDPDPTKFLWIMATSPRVEDIPDGLGGWTTQLVLNMGPSGVGRDEYRFVSSSEHYGEQFVVLDISNPLGSPPFTVVAHSQQMTSGSGNVQDVLGETWSLPVLFYDGGSPVSARAAMGSGYNPIGASSAWTGRGDTYLYFFPDASLSPGLWGNLPPHAGWHDRSTKEVPDWGLITDTVAVINSTNQRKVVATYQANLSGKIVRYEKGDPAIAQTDVVDAGASNPFYYSPAAYYYEAGNTTVLAAVSGSFDEAKPPSTIPQATLYMRADGATTPSITCAATNICNGCSEAWDKTLPVCAADESTLSCCKAPLASEHARPVSSPFLVYNPKVTGWMEAMYLLQTKDPASKCGIGDTYFIRLAGNAPGSTAWRQLITARKLSDTRTAGMTVVLGGSDIVFTKSGLGDKVAMPQAVGQQLGFNGLATSTAVVESWREIR